MVQPMDATAYAIPNKNIENTVRSLPPAIAGVVNLGFQPRNIARPIATSAIPITRDAYFAFCSIQLVKRREILPTRRNTAMKPLDVAAPTSSALRNVARCELFGRDPSSPRKYMRYVGSNTKPHGFTAARTPRIKL